MKATIFLIALLTSTHFAQDFLVSEGWKGLKPFQSTKVQVEKIFGDPAVEDIETIYRNSDAILILTYSGKPCSEAGGPPSRFNLPENTVINYRVNLKSVIDLRQLSFEKDKYERIEDPHLKGEFIYSSSALGITFRTILADDGTERVTSIRYVVPPKFLERYKCN